MASHSCAEIYQILREANSPCALGLHEVFTSHYNFAWMYDPMYDVWSMYDIRSFSKSFSVQEISLLSIVVYKSPI